MNFNRSTFATRLTSYNPLHPSDGTNWDQWSGTTGTLNQKLDYYISSSADRDGKLDYRTWSPEQSNLPTNLGGLLSCKIDYANGLFDDHMVMIVGFMHFEAGTQMVFVQTSVQFNGDEDNNIEGTPIMSSDPNFDFPGAVYNALYSTIQSKYPGSDDTAVGRRQLAAVAKANCYAFQGSVSF